MDFIPKYLEAHSNFPLISFLSSFSIFLLEIKQQ